MNEQKLPLPKKFQNLLGELGEVAAAMGREDWEPGTVPHYLQIELAAHEVGRQVSRVIQQNQLAELTNQQGKQAACPNCGQQCSLHSTKREIQSIDGPVEQVEPQAHCPLCRRDFFPSA